MRYYLIILLISTGLHAEDKLRVDANGKNYWRNECVGTCTVTPTATMSVSPTITRTPTPKKIATPKPTATKVPK